MRARSSLLTAVAVAALVAGAAVAHAAPAPRVAVLIGESIGVEPAEADALGAALAIALSNQLKVDASGGVEVSRRLPPAGLPDECLATPTCVADLGNRLGADRLLVLVVIRAGAEVQVDAREIVVATSASTPRPRVQISDLTPAETTFAEAAPRYLPDAEARKVSTTIVVGENHRPVKPVVWVLGGVGLASLAGSGILGLTVKNKYDACEKDGGCPKSERDSIHTRGLIADVALGVGVAAIAAAIIVYVRTPTEASELQPSVAPVDGGAVVGVGGRF